MASPTTSFTTSRINASTYLIVETDQYGEWPYIYAKLHPTEPILFLSDTGCNAPRDKSVGVSNLREYLENYPVSANEGKPLNPIIESEDSKDVHERQYVVFCTHCHYDHIGGIQAFSNQESASDEKAIKPVIVASSNDPDFILKDLATHSLCRFKDPPIKTPEYDVTLWAHDYGKLYAGPGKNICVDSGRSRDQRRSHSKSLGVTLIHTPGHTPDSLTWWDEKERWLYTGDSFYERGKEDMPIIFPAEGNILHFVQTLQKLVVFVRDENIAEEQRTAERERENEHDFEVLSRRIKVGCAHQTAGADAEEIMMTTYRLMKAIVDGKVPVVSSRKQRGEPVDLWQESKTARMSVLAPRRLVENVREEIARRKREMQPLPEGFEEGVDESGWHLPKVDCAPTCQRKQRRHVRRLNPPRFVMYSSSTTAISLPEQPLPANADPR